MIRPSCTAVKYVYCYYCMITVTPWYFISTFLRIVSMLLEYVYANQRYWSRLMRQTIFSTCFIRNFLVSFVSSSPPLHCFVPDWTVGESIRTSKASLKKKGNIRVTSETKIPIPNHWPIFLHGRTGRIHISISYLLQGQLR